MANNSKIEWCDSTWNPIAGCTPVSPGCTHCYAATMARRLEAMGQEKYAGTAERRGGTTGRALDVFTGRINLDTASLEAPLRWRKPRRIFVNSMSDLFHEGVSCEFIERCFAVMSQCPRHQFLVLTKRPARMRELLHERGDVELAAERMFGPGAMRGCRWPLPNVWLGVSVEDQIRAHERIPLLLQTPAAVRFLSCEPLLGPIDLHAETRRARMEIDWVIVGGESGPHARPMRAEWARQIRDQCLAARPSVSFFFKQWGEYVSCTEGGEPLRLGKKSTGRMLDGRYWDEFPSGRATELREITEIRNKELRCG